MKLETGMMWAQVKELWEPPEAGKSDEASSPSAFRDSTSQPTLWLWTSGRQNYKTMCVFGFNSRTFRNSLMASQQTE